MAITTGARRGYSSGGKHGLAGSSVRAIGDQSALGPLCGLVAGCPRPCPDGGPGSSTTGGRTATRTANNVREYRFVRDHPSFSGVNSSQSGKPSHCSGPHAPAAAPQAGHPAHSGRPPIHGAAGAAPRGQREIYGHNDTRAPLRGRRCGPRVVRASAGAGRGHGTRGTK
jgi:hypothetical protein